MGKRKLWSGIGAFVGMLILILDGKIAMEGAQIGVELCIRTVIPSLFPFFLLSILVTGTLLGEKLPLLTGIGRLFHIPKGAESILIPAFLGGYPVGAQCIAQSFRAGQLDRATAERMLAFCSNAGPAFLFGMVGSIFPKRWMVWAIWGILILSAWLVSLLYPCRNSEAAFQPGEEVSVTAALSSATRVMASVCGWVVLFRVIIAFLSRWCLWVFPTLVQVAITGILELSNGCCELTAVTDIPLRFVLCTGMLSLGGICVTLQTLSVTGGLSLKYYFPGKLLQTAFSILLAASIACRLPFLLLLIPVPFLLRLRKKENSSSIPGILGV